MWNGKRKAMTFSYDDGVTQDIRLIEILNKYGLKCTFNLNSQRLGQSSTLIRDGVEISHCKIKPADVRNIYAGHEIAAHTLTHPCLLSLSDEDVVKQVEQDRLNLSELAGYEVLGFAYPGGAPNHDQRISGLIRNRTGIRYARTVETTMSFAPQKDIYSVRGTLYHHAEWNRLFEMGERFLNAEAGELYIWGHAYEFDIYPERWALFEEFCRMMSGKDDIFYGTNKEVLLTSIESDIAAGITASGLNTRNHTLVHLD